MYRLTFRCVAILCVVLQHAALDAGDRSSALPEGSLVLARRAGVKFRIKNEDVGAMHAGVIVRVQKAQGEWLWLGRGWVQRRDVVPLGEAIEYFTSEIGRKPSAFCYIGRSSAATKLGNFATSASGDIEKALALDPDFAPAYWRRATAFLAEYDYDRVIEAIDDAIRLDPKFAEVYVYRGTAWAGKGNLDKGLRDCKRAIQLCPTLAMAYAGLSSILNAMGDREHALSQAHEALKHDPADTFAYSMIGSYWLANGNDDQAIAAYTNAIHVDNNYGPAFLQRGKLYSRQGDFQKALIDLDRAVEIMPKDADAIEARAYAYYRLGKMDESSADRTAAARMRKKSPVIHPKSTESNDNQTTAESTTNKAVPPTNEASAGTANIDTANLPVAETKSSPAQQLNNSARRKATSTDERYLNGPRAVELATEACTKTEWKRAKFIDTLAAAYAETGDFEAAIQWQTKAIELSAANSAFKAAAEERLELYRAHQPCREDSPGRLARSKTADGDAR